MPEDHAEASQEHASEKDHEARQPEVVDLELQDDDGSEVRGGAGGKGGSNKLGGPLGGPAGGV